MRKRVYSLHPQVSHWRSIAPEIFLVLALALLMAVPQAGAAALRFQERSLYMNSTTPGAETYYKVSFRYMSALPVGSVDMLFCVDPIPYHACVPPEGLDVSQADLVTQTGESDFSIRSKSSNRIILTRSAGAVPVNNESSYTFDNIVNPTDTTQSFSIRLKSHVSDDASGPQIDFGSLKGQVADGVTVETQVPPMLIFCLAEEVEENCSRTSDKYYRDMGTIDETSTVSAQSQMAVGTNASRGFAITVYGKPVSAGIHQIDSLVEPTESVPGRSQFGINLVENTQPAVGKNPEGTWANAVVAEGYDEPNKFKFISGDIVAYSPNVSLMKKFTASYVMNAAPTLKAGVYSTTVTYIASGRF